jgi:hypothetical protein
VAISDYFKPPIRVATLPCKATPAMVRDYNRITELMDLLSGPFEPGVVVLHFDRAEPINTRLETAVGPQLTTELFFRDEWFPVLVESYKDKESPDLSHHLRWRITDERNIAIQAAISGCPITEDSGSIFSVRLVVDGDQVMAEVYFTEHREDP